MPFMFQSLDWVDVDFDVAVNRSWFLITKFQSLDWVDVDFDNVALTYLGEPTVSFNPSTGLMLISTWTDVVAEFNEWSFQSLDWVDVDFDARNAVERMGV